jgi:hypothetical protein
MTWQMPKTALPLRKRTGLSKLKMIDFITIFFISEVNEKEREKIQATEKLRKDMLYKIKETKANLLALNDEQL